MKSAEEETPAATSTCNRNIRGGKAAAIEGKPTRIATFSQEFLDNS